jgi:uncharacterized protein involved in exopolysaccharide biosynthesis
MSSNVESAHVASASVDARSGSFIQAVLASLWRRKALLVAIVAAALTLAVVTLFVLPARYTAQAYIRGEFFSAPDMVAKDEQSTTTGSMNLDLVRVIETQSQLLLESQPIARRVVQQIGLERLQPLVSKRRFWPAFGSTSKTQGDDVDTAAARLSRGLAVISNPHTYLLVIQYRAGDPELAELVANAFVAELLRSTKMQALFKQRSLAEAALAIQRAKFGDKHPGMAQAKMRLATIDALLEEQLNKSQQAILQTAGENVTLATSNPSSPTIVVICLVLLAGLAISVAVALWLERDRWWAHLQPSLTTH